MKYDLNCDLGEGEPRQRTRALMQWITSANIACGGHAGDVNAMDFCIQEALQQGVKIGAHPGTWDKTSFGREGGHLHPKELEMLLLHQISALNTIASRHGTRLHHVKLHGALYHAVERNRALRQCFLKTIKDHWPKLILYCFAGGKVADDAKSFQLTVWEEGFVDRAYHHDGSLVHRGSPNALITNLPQIHSRLERMKQHHELLSVENTVLPFNPKTLCVHSDTPGATRIAKTIATSLNLPIR